MPIWGWGNYSLYYMWAKHSSNRSNGRSIRRWIVVLVLGGAEQLRGAQPAYAVVEGMVLRCPTQRCAFVSQMLPSLGIKQSRPTPRRAGRELALCWVAVNSCVLLRCGHRIVGDVVLRASLWCFEHHYLAFGMAALAARVDVLHL